MVRLLSQTVRDGTLVSGPGGPVGLGGVTVGPGQGPQAHRVDDAGEGVLGADGQLHDRRHRVQSCADRGDGGVQSGTGPVHLGDERDARYAVPVGLPPHRLALRLHARDRVEHRDRAVEDP